MKTRGSALLSILVSGVFFILFSQRSIAQDTVSCWIIGDDIALYSKQANLPEWPVMKHTDNPVQDSLDYFTAKEQWLLKCISILETYMDPKYRERFREKMKSDNLKEIIKEMNKYPIEDFINDSHF